VTCKLANTSIGLSLPKRFVAAVLESLTQVLTATDNPWDTSPNNDKGVDQELRGGQLDLRLAEIEEAYKIMHIINAGIATQNMRQKGYKASSSHGLEDVDWTAWKDRVDTEYVVAAGHSFGAATVVDMLRHEKRFKWVAQGIIYDIWG
jgi:platelet-activating factor acetylhydrolase